MQWLAEICVRRPVFASVLILSLTVVGAFAFGQLGVDRLPQVDFPTVAVTTRLPGAAPEQVESEGAMSAASMTQVSNPCPGHKITKYLIFGAASFDSRAMTTVAITNRKGGVGKSSVTVNLAAALALAGRKVLVIDMDSQHRGRAGLRDAGVRSAT